MTIGRELILKLKAKLNKLDTSSNRSLRPEMALEFLNDAHIKLVRAKYSKDGGAQDTTAFQYSQLTTDELDPYTKNIKLDFIASGQRDQKVDGEYHIEKGDLDNYFIHLNSLIQTKFNENSGWKTPNYMTLDQVATTRNDPFNNSVFSAPVMYQEENKFKIIADDFEVNAVKISYLIKPKTITVDSTVVCPFEDELVDTAATLILENWQDGRVQSQPVINQTIASK